MKIEEVDFPKLVEDCQNLSRKTTGSPDVYELLNKCLFGYESPIQTVTEQVFNILVMDMGYSVQELMPWR